VRHATRHNKRDHNERELVKAMADMGFEWHESGPLDGWIALQGKHVPVEIKNGKNKLTDSQKKFIAYCDRKGLPYAIWRTVDEVVNSLTRIKYVSGP